MPKLHLISHHLCPYVQRAVIVLTEKEIPHERTYIDLANKPDWFAEISPLGRVPVLKTNGAIVFESQVIAEYLDEVTPGSLHPIDPLEKAHHRSWIEFGSETLNAIAAFYNARTANDFEEKRLNLRSKFERIERELTGPFFAGETFCMIDGIWGTIFRYVDVFDQIGDFDLVPKKSKLREWRTVVMKRSSVTQAPPEGYEERLRLFLSNRKTHISTFIANIA